MRGGRMRKQMMFVTFWMFFFTASSALTGSSYYDYSYARMSYVQGDVFIQRAEDLGYEEGVVNLALIKGDKLGIRDGRAEIHLGKRNYLRVNSYTQLDIAGLPDEYNYHVQLHLISGEIFLRINAMEREKDIEVHTPDASYYFLENGLYRIRVRDNLETELRVLSGAVEAAAEEGSLVVTAEESLRTAEGRFLNHPVSLRAVETDSFYEWNRSRDAMHSRRVERHYLPHNLYDYEAELAYHGDWVHQGSFGYVWVPRVTRSNWRPYWNGRWVWYPVIGWTWVSYEPWGWCVSRYGRWHWGARLGWYWIPTRTWGPAWVHWHYGSHYVGWSPLSYWGYPGVIVNNHYYGRHYRDSYPLHSRALTMVRKDQLQARHISRVSLARNQITKVSKISLSSRQPDIRPAVNRDSARTRVAAQALERSETRSVNRLFSGNSSAAVRSRVESSRIRKTGGTAEASETPSRISRSGLIRENAPRRINTEKQGTAARTGTADRGRVEGNRASSSASTRIKTFPPREVRGTRSTGSDQRTRENSSRTVRRENIIPRVSTTGTGRNKSSGASSSGRIKKYPSTSIDSGKRSAGSNDRALSNRAPAVSSPERRGSAVSSRDRTYPSSRSILNQTRSSRYISGRSSSSPDTLRRSVSSSPRGLSSRSSSYIRRNSSPPTFSVKPRSSSPRTSLLSRSSSRSSVTRSLSSGSVRSRSGSTAGKTASRSSSGKTRKK